MSQAQDQPTLVWKRAHRSAARSVAISERSWNNTRPTMAVAASYRHERHSDAPNQAVTVHYEADDSSRLTATEGECRSVSLSQDGQYLATGATDRYATLYKAQDCAKIWEYKANASVDDVALSANGEALAIASRDRHCHLFSTLSNIPLWSIEADDPLTHVAINADGSKVAFATQRGAIVTVDAWARQQHVAQNEHAAATAGVALDHSGQRLAVAHLRPPLLSIYDGPAHLVSQWPVASPPQAIAMTASSDAVAALLANRTLIYYQNSPTQPNKYQPKWQYRLPADGLDIAMTRNGLYITIGMADGTAIILHNPATTDAPTAVNSSAWMAPRIVRAAYSANPAWGICAWFDMFTRSFHRSKTLMCQELLKEIRQRGYSLTNEEKQIVSSHEAMLELYLGAHYQINGKQDEANAHYQRARSIYEHIGFTNGIISAEEMPNQTAALLAAFPYPIERSGQTLMQGRWGLTHTMPDRLALVLAARESGWSDFLSELLITEHSDLHTPAEEACIRANAVAACERLSMEPRHIITITAALSDIYWLVRWRSSALLRRMYQTPELRAAIAAYRVNYQHSLDRETHVLVRQELQQLVKEVS